MSRYGFSASSDDNSGDEGPPEISENLLQIQIYFDSLNIKNVEETQTYEFMVKIN